MAHDKETARGRPVWIGKLSKTFRPLDFPAFTLAELIVVVTILAVLATIGFIALSGYAQDAKDSRAKTNVRSVYSAIVSESALTGNSPRFYVIHDSWFALSGAAVAFVSWSPSTVLTGGQWNEPNTNYSAGNPDFQKLKLNPDKFRVSWSFDPFLQKAEAADSTQPLVGAADGTATSSSDGKTRTTSYVQVVGIQPSWTAFVVGNYPVAETGSSDGLVKDPTDPSLTWAITEWAPAGWAVACLATAWSGYSIPWLADGQSWLGTKPVTNGTSLVSVSCSNGTFSYGTPYASCDPYYSANGNSCVANVWSSGSWGACAWETGTWSYGSWGWCSVSCGWGTQTRTASCVRWYNGTQTRTANCLKYDSSVLADSACSGTKPATSQTCTQGTDAVCWTSVTAQSCNVQTCPSCGPANGGPATSSAPTSGLCYSGNPSAVTTAVGTTNPWYWTCTDPIWGSSVGCAEAKAPLYNTSQFNTSNVGDAPCTWYPSISDWSGWWCTCMTNQNTTSPTCNANSYMTHGNNTASCVYTCNLRPIN